MSVLLAPGKYYGETLRSAKLPSFELSERIYSPGYRTPKHTHKQALFCFVMQGNYTETYGSQMRECHTSNLLFHPPGELHAEHFHEAGGHSFIVEIAPAWLNRVNECLPVAQSSTSFQGPTFEMLARKLHREFLNTDEATSLIIEGLMMQMVGETARYRVVKDNHRSPQWLRQARELLHEKFTENLTLSEIASNVGVHPVHLAQTFHKAFECTVGDYVRKLRIDYACRELASTSRPIVEIALASGFCDQSHFTRTFKRVVGTAPSQYRETLRQP